MQFGRFIRRTLVGLALASVAVAGFPDPLRAEPRREPSRAELEERIRRLEKIIEERGLDKPAAKPSAAAAAEAGPPVDKAEVEAIVDSSLKKQKMLAGWKDGFFLESPSGDFKLKLRGYVQADARVFPNNGGDTGFNNFTLRRVRPILEGTVYKYFDYKIMPDFGGGTATIQDAWGGTGHPAATPSKKDCVNAAFSRRKPRAGPCVEARRPTYTPIVRSGASHDATCPRARFERHQTQRKTGASSQPS